MTTVKAKTIGIEIEFTGITRKMAANALHKLFSSEVTYYGGTYDEYRINDSQGRIWAVKYDGSLKPQRKTREGYTVTANTDRRCELVSPILTYEDLELLQSIVDRIEKAGGFVNQTCGIHIHIGAESFSPEKLKDLVNMMTSKEDLIYRALEIYENRITYCRKTDERILQDLNNKNPKDKDELAKIWYNEEDLDKVKNIIKTKHYHHSRYTHTNLHAFFTKGTIEFRFFNSTLNPILIKSYIQFCLAIINKVLESNKAIKFKKTVLDNEKYLMRSWLRQLGLNGEEYRDCRYTFLNKLSGDLVNRVAS